MFTGVSTSRVVTGTTRKMWEDDNLSRVTDIG